MNKPETIKIDDVEYVRKDSAAQAVDGMPYVIVRTLSAGVFAGYIASRTGQEVEMRNARRVYYWAGAATLSQASQDGFSKPNDCKFPCEVPVVTLLQAIEILPCTQKAQASIAGVKVWKA